MEIIDTPIGDVKPYENNPRNNDQAVAKVAESIRRFDWQSPIIVDRDMVIIAGHTRLKAAQSLGLKTVPVRIAKDLDENKAREFRIADNRTAQEAEWNDDMLALELNKIIDAGGDIGSTGFDGDEIEALLAKAMVSEGLTDEDAVPEAPADAVTKPGDVWILGKHRLMCGDSGVITDVDKLMDGKIADICLTDPPYGLGAGKDSGKNDYAEYDDTRENLIELAKLWLPIATTISKAVVFSPGVTNQWLYPEPNWVICWFYGGGPLRSSWGFNCWQPFLCYGKDPSLASGNGGRPDAVDMNTPANAKDIDHPCPKPVKLWLWLLDRLVFSPNAVLFEPFSGSGTTIIAAEQKGVSVCAMELTPIYCDIAVKRWEEYTGNKAVLKAA